MIWVKIASRLALPEISQSFMASSAERGFTSRSDTTFWSYCGGVKDD